MNEIDSKELEKRLEGLKDEIFLTLRQERDRKRDVIQQGIIKVNPQTFTPNQQVMVGPYSFNTRFTNTPIVTFGQVNHTHTQDNISQIDPQSTLFLVIPYVARWNFTQGAVDGFYLGMYPLLAPPVGVKKHTIMWQAKGKATQDRNQQQNSAWSHSYDNNQAVNLIQTNSNILKP